VHQFVPPNYVLEILRRLDGLGYESYMVGGCVRDLLMGKRPHDWDLCTSALPEAVMAAFPRTHPTGLKHGTVTVVSRGHPVEVTTFRADGPYTDRRRPDSVHFVTGLQDDLARRDFTVNALAMDAAGIITDPFGGQDDLRAKCLRCVGDPDRRFGEDALRMLRALRFSAVLGFEIAPETYAAIRRNAALTEELAKERVRAELEKMLLSPAPGHLAELIGLGLLGSLTAQTAVPDLAFLGRLPKKGALRWSALCTLLERAGAIADAEAFLRALRLDSATLHAAARGCRLALEGPAQDAVSWKRLLARHGEVTAVCAAAACEALGVAGSLRRLQAILRSGECFSREGLAVSGTELEQLGFRGPALGEMLSALLEHVIEHPEDNERALLLGLTQQLRPR
jgi:tRNA nucleotidyltransferase (CCA-adding enzyme)